MPIGIVCARAGCYAFEMKSNHLPCDEEGSNYNVLKRNNAVMERTAAKLDDELRDERNGGPSFFIDVFSL